MDIGRGIGEAAGLLLCFATTRIGLSSACWPWFFGNDSGVSIRSGDSSVDTAQQYYFGLDWGEEGCYKRSMLIFPAPISYGTGTNEQFVHLKLCHGVTAPIRDFQLASRQWKQSGKIAIPGAVHMVTVFNMLLLGPDVAMPALLPLPCFVVR